MIKNCLTKFRPLLRHFSEVEKSQHPHIPSEDEQTVFDKIVNREIKASVVFEDSKVLAFHDISPQAPTHIVLVPKQRNGLTGLKACQEKHKELLGHMVWAASQVAQQQGLEEGWRLVVNDGKHGSQSVYHLHFHILGGRQMGWPPG